MKLLLIDTDEIHRYSLGAEHPMGPNRVDAALKLSHQLGILEAFEVSQPEGATDEILELVHSKAYIQATRANQSNPQFGIGTVDNPVAPGLADVAGRISSGTLDATRAVWEGTADRAVNLAGGLHHAFPDSMSGFCMYNDAAIAITWLLENTNIERVAYVDFDAHHGDGVEKIFWDDPRVLTISVHESGLYLFPGSGHAHEIGGVSAAGTAINIAVSKNARDHEWLQSIHAVVPAVLQKFAPELIISQHGADPHRLDPLTDLELSMDAMALAYHSMSAWAEQFANGKWVALGGGGYEPSGVSRAWTHVLGAVSKQLIDATTKVSPNLHMGDEGVDLGALEQFSPCHVTTSQPSPALVATSRAVFPYWGLRPYG